MKKNNNKKRGIQYEYSMYKLLSRRGYHCIRSAGSKGIVDLIAIPNTNTKKFILAIQCKTVSSGRYISFSEKNISLLEKFALDTPLRGVVKCVLLVKQDRKTTQYVFFRGEWRRTKLF